MGYHSSCTFGVWRLLSILSPSWNLGCATLGESLPLSDPCFTQLQREIEKYLLSMIMGISEAQRTASAQYKVALTLPTHSFVPLLPFSYSLVSLIFSLSFKLSSYCIFQKSSVALFSGLSLHPMHTSVTASALILCSSFTWLELFYLCPSYTEPFLLPWWSLSGLLKNVSQCLKEDLSLSLGVNYLLALWLWARESKFSHRVVGIIKCMWLCFKHSGNINYLHSWRWKWYFYQISPWCIKAIYLCCSAVCLVIH